MMAIKIDDWGELALAPMVDQSELPFRLLCKKYGATVTWTPMMHAALFVKDATYRKENLSTSPEDRPLVVQFCANDPQTFLSASKMVESIADAVDLNLGCPQGIARKGHYGAFLQDEWSLIEQIVSLASSSLSIPVCCKIRIFPSVDKTISYAKMLVRAGASLLTVHGRTREQKGALTGAADWQQIAAVKAALNVPVYANGNIQFKENICQCLEATKADGIMSAEGMLYNPALFAGKHKPAWVLANEYLDLYDLHPTNFGHAKAHMFKLLHHLLQLDDNVHLRDAVTQAGRVEDFRPILLQIKEKYCQPDIDYETFEMEMTTLPVPVYMSQPHFRKDRLTMNKEEGTKVTIGVSTEGDSLSVKTSKRSFDQLTEGDEVLSNRMRKKLMKQQRIQAKIGRSKSKVDRVTLELCIQCKNPRGMTCSFSLCRVCCKVKRSDSHLTCDNHSRKLVMSKEHHLTNQVAREVQVNHVDSCDV